MEKTVYETRTTNSAERHNFQPAYYKKNTDYFIYY